MRIGLTARQNHLILILGITLLGFGGGIWTLKRLAGWVKQAFPSKPYEAVTLLPTQNATATAIPSARPMPQSSPAQQPDPLPQPSPLPEQAPERIPAAKEPVQAESPQVVIQEPPKRIIEQPKFTDVSFVSSTEGIFSSEGIIYSVRVYRIRTVNNLTAITFKVDGSATTRSGVLILCPTGQDDFVTINSHMVDNNGNRYNLISNTILTPEYLDCQNGFYQLAAHEVVYPTYLFNKLSSTATSFDI